MTDKRENPLNLSAKARRNLYLKNREQISNSPIESLCLLSFDRLHGLNQQEFPRLHEYRLGWLEGRRYQVAALSDSTLDEKVVLSKDTYTAWVDAVLKASAEINRLETLVSSLGALETVDQYVERLR